MNGFEKFLAGKKAKSAKAWSHFEEKYRGPAIGILLADYREKAGLSLSELSRRIKMRNRRFLASKTMAKTSACPP